MISQYLANKNVEPIFLCGDSLEILKSLPNSCVDMAMTSPPYWRKREYDISECVGMEKNMRII